MDERNITFSDIEIEKHKFHYHKNPMLLDDSKVSVKKNEKKDNQLLLRLLQK